MDEEKMPKGHCRYILLLPEIKGQRCACVGFSHNKGIPGSTCDCGHLACFHNKDLEAPNDQKQELDMLKKRLQQLEDQLSRGQEDVLEGVVSRLNDVEDTVEKSREEFSEQIRGTYRHVSVSWGSIKQVERETSQHGEQIRHILEKLSAHDEQFDRLRAGQMELQDADISLEERIENLMEDQEEFFQSRPRDRHQRRRSTSDTSRPNFPLGPVAPLAMGGVVPDGSRRPLASLAETSAPAPTHSGVYGHDGIVVPRIPRPAPASARSTGAWTVHISLLPHAFVPMPFERNTNAYQRCLSRGLHQMVAVHGRDAESFTSAVEKAFGSFLKGPWMPLQAKLCDAEQLQGLPMLRQLEPHMVNSRYDHEFLRTHCAVCDNSGMIDSLYIAMRRHTISWHTLRHSPVFMEGLEDAWAYDALLEPDPSDDNMAVDDVDRPAAGEINGLPPIPLSSSKKRTVTEMSRSNSFGSAGSPTVDSDEARAKRTCPAVPAGPPSSTTLVDIRRRGVETA